MNEQNITSVHQMAMESEIMKEHNSKLLLKMILQIILFGLGLGFGVISMVMASTNENPTFMILTTMLSLVFSNINLFIEYLKQINNPPNKG